LPTFVVPNIVDVDEYAADSAEDPRKILFQAGMDWYPNRDAVEFFVAQVFSRIRSQVPNVRFVVAGRNPPEEFRQRLGRVPGVEFTGTVLDMRVEIASAAVCVVPLRIGSGTRLKILEAAAMAKPIVSTRMGAEGLEFRDGKEIALEDEPAAFADAVVKLLNAAPDRHRLGQAARKRVEQNYSFLALRASLREALNTFTRDASLARSASVRETLGGS
jgi:glycosyltransferase involved in cell wall biosynthesis